MTNSEIISYKIKMFNQQDSNTMFPLFSTIFQETENNNSLSVSECSELCEKIKNLDVEGNEILFAIIRHYQLEINDGNFNDMPFQCKQNKSGYKMNMTKFPKRLVNIINHFVNLHLNKLHEEKQRNNFFQ